MKNKQFLVGIISVLLIFVIQTVNADNNFGRFNADAPVFGFVELKGYSKAPTARDLTLNANFVNNGDIRVIVRDRDFDHDELELQLDRYNGSSRIARLEIKIETYRSDSKNYITHFKYWSSQTGEDQSEYRGNRSSLERNFDHFFSIIEQFYQVNILLPK
jgi:hypothetical protein